jgi:putative ABC transport system permease protein
MDTIFADVRSGVRMLATYPALSLVAVLTLGLGIGLSTTVFCVVNGGLFKGLPFPGADRVVSVVAANPSQRQPLQPVSVQDLAVFQEAQTSFENIGAFSIDTLNLANPDGRPDRFSGGELTVAAFDAVGVQPILGRGFREGDDRPGADPVILLGNQLWRERYASAPDIVGQTLRANGVVRTIIGVMPEKFAFPIREAAWIPFAVDPRAKPRGEDPKYLVIARLKTGRRRRPGEGGDRGARVAASARLPGDQ